jgi:drug/metabolite transporter (DMT)-like permease
MYEWLFLGLLTAFCYASQNLTTRWMLRGARNSTIAFSTLATAISAAYMFAVFLLVFRVPLDGGAILIGAVSGILINASSLLWGHVSKTKEASYYSPFVQTDAVFVFLAGIFLLGEQLSALNVAGALAVFAGGYVISSRNLVPVLSWAVPLLLLSAVFNAANIVLVKQYSAYFLPITIALFAVFFRLVFYSVMAALWRRQRLRALVRELRGSRKARAVLVLRALASGTAMLAMFYAVSLGLIAKVAAIVNFTPFFTVVLGALLLRERETKKRLFGAAVMIAGSFFVVS